MLRLLLLLFMGAIYLCKCEEIPCKVTVDEERASYFVPDSTKGHDCVYVWSTDVVLANNNEKIDSLVSASNMTLLQSLGCFKVVQYSRDCIDGGDPENATCFANCTWTGTRTGPETYSWIAPVVPLIVLLIVGILCCVFRDKLCRLGKRTYNLVRQRREESDDVEAQRV